MDRCAYKFSGDDSIDERTAAFDVECLTRDADGVEELLGGDGYVDVCVGEQVAASIVDGDDAFTDAACAVGDDGGGSELDVAVPDAVGLGVPDDFDSLAGESAPISGSSK